MKQSIHFDIERTEKKHVIWEITKKFDAIKYIKHSSLKKIISFIQQRLFKRFDKFSINKQRSDMFINILSVHFGSEP